MYDKRLFLENSLVKKTTRLSWGNNSIINSLGISKIAFEYNNHKIILNDCLFVPTFSVNIISVPKLIKNNF